MLNNDEKCRKNAILTNNPVAFWLTSDVTKLIQLPFWGDNPVALFGWQSSCPSWLTQVEVWFIFYHFLKYDNVDWDLHDLRSLAPEPDISDVGHFEKINDEVWQVLFVL